MEDRRMDSRAKRRLEIRRKRILRNRLVSIAILVVLLLILYSGLKALISTFSSKASEKAPISSKQTGKQVNETVSKSDKLNDKEYIYRIPEKKLGLNFEQKIEKYNELPEVLKEKINQYPNTEDTIFSYDLSKKEPDSIDISKDIQISKKTKVRKNLPYFSQWDERWGGSYFQGDYLANIGCGPTTLSSVYIGLTGDIKMNPYEMAKFAINGGWLFDTGSARELMTEGAKELGLKSDFIDLDEKSIKKALDKDSVVILLVHKGDFTTTGHFIVLQSYDENGVYLFDVNSYENTNKQWDLKRVLDQTAVGWKISK